MNEKQANRNYIIAVIILSALLAVSVGCNIGLGRGVADNQRLRDSQRELERTVTQLTAERDTERAAADSLRELSGEARNIISTALDTTVSTGTDLARANALLRSAISALQSLELLYGRDSGGRGNGLDFVSGE